MGIHLTAIKSFKLLKNLNNEEKYNRALTLGRQNIYLNTKKIKSIFKDLSQESILKIENEKFGNYADSLIKEILNIEELDSLDFSDYEGAKIIHDMNIPIPDEIKEKYDLVYDGGTLEHIFNFPIAIKNVMEMIKINGYLLSVTCCNNLSGHGFYQFSPELFFRVFSEENGFKVLGIFISVKGVLYKVTDPKDIKSRVIFINNKETEIITIAKKIKTIEIFKKSPYQSDYVEEWKNKKDNSFKAKNNLFKKIKTKLKTIFINYFLIYKKSFFSKVKEL